jgi:hypothetical protein
MVRLIYVSQASLLVTEEELKKILESSQLSNAAKDITGVLVYGGNTFLQYLEGPDDSVIELYLRILKDPRHINCSLVYISSTEHRVFEDWSMGLIMSDPINIERFLDIKMRGIDAISPKAFTELIREFVNTLNQANAA